MGELHRRVDGTKEYYKEEDFSQPSGFPLTSFLSTARRCCHALQYIGASPLAVLTMLCPLRTFGVHTLFRTGRMRKADHWHHGC